jgi:hypothetical protein
MHLRTAAQLGGYLLPALPLACCELAASAAQLSFLNGALNPQRAHSSPQTSGQLLPPEQQRDAAAQYALEAAAGGWWGGANARLLLTPAEGARVPAAALPAPPAPPAAASVPPLRLGLARQVEVAECPVVADFVEGAEDALVRLVLPPSRHRASRPYPLREPDNASLAEAAFHRELRASWEEYDRLEEADRVAQGAQDRVAEMKVGGWGPGLDRWVVLLVGCPGRSKAHLARLGQLAALQFPFKTISGAHLWPHLSGGGVGAARQGGGLRPGRRGQHRERRGWSGAQVGCWPSWVLASGQGQKASPCAVTPHTIAPHSGASRAAPHPHTACVPATLPQVPPPGRRRPRRGPRGPAALCAGPRPAAALQPAAQRRLAKTPGCGVPAVGQGGRLAETLPAVPAMLPHFHA